MNYDHTESQDNQPNSESCNVLFLSSRFRVEHYINDGLEILWRDEVGNIYSTFILGMTVSDYRQKIQEVLDRPCYTDGMIEEVLERYIDVMKLVVYH